MRVLQLNTHACGGSYEYAALLSSALTEQGIESHVLCKNPSLAQNGRPLLDRIVRRTYVSFSIEPWHGTWRVLAPPTAEDLEGVDVVHLHVVADWFNVPKWLETLPRRIGVVISLHDMWHVSGGCFLYRGCGRYSDEVQPCVACPILKWPANRVLASAAYRRKLRAYQKCEARMVANSHWLAEIAGRSQIAQACGGVRVIPPGIDTTVFKPQDRNLCRKSLGLPADAFVVVTGGASLNDINKNVAWLFQQLSHLPDLSDVIVVAFGDGAAAVPDDLNVRFTGGISERTDLAGLLAAADVFVSASLIETYGLTLVEAMACGTPVVAFRVGGIPEAVPDGKAGILCELSDASGLLAAIEELRSSRDLRHQLGASASKLPLSRNDKGKFAAAFARVYEDCLKTAGRPFAGQGSQSSPLHSHCEKTMEGGAPRRRRSAIVP
jgi:glycosyltransferase involved in cell wall biosynthesis